MPNALKQFGARATGSFNKRFHLSLVKLTLFYVGILIIILFLSSSITYSAFTSRIQHRFEFHPDNHSSIIIDQNLPKPEDLQADLIYSLIMVNGILLIGAAALSYVLALITLDPIKAAFERQRKFFSDASHELRTPLSILHTDLENELADTSIGEKTKARAQSNLEEVDRMNKLINDLLVLSRMDENGEAESQKKSLIDLGKLISDVVDRMQPLAKQHSVKLNFDSSKIENLEITSNSDTLSQILTNIIKNAITYNHANGEVNIHLQKIKSQVKIEIADTGIGINKEDLEKIFDRFYRAEKSRSRQTGGSGLGLSIVQSSIEQLGGTVAISSEPEKGTQVTLTLPA